MTTLQMLQPEADDDYTAEDAASELATVARVLRIARDAVDLEDGDQQALLNLVEPEVQRVLARLNELALRR
jgi:hypothetical protein